MKRESRSSDRICPPARSPTRRRRQCLGRLLLAWTAFQLVGGCFLFRPNGTESGNPSSADVSATNAPLVFLDRPSPNFDRRKLPVSLIVLHYTGAPFRESLNTLTDGRGTNRVSSHYLVDEDGTICRLVDESKRAWHAGVSRWDEITDVNSASIGIEIANCGPLANGQFQPFHPRQVEAVSRLCLDIQSRYDIKAVVGHSDVAPLRKIDPGPCFPWERLKAHGVTVRAH